MALKVKDQDGVIRIIPESFEVSDRVAKAFGKEQGRAQTEETALSIRIENNQIKLAEVEEKLNNLVLSGGTAGEDGVGIQDILINSEGHLVVTLTNNTKMDLGNVKGDDGVGIADASINENALVITLTDGTVKNLGSVCGFDGAPGTPGTRWYSVFNESQLTNVLTSLARAGDYILISTEAMQPTYSLGGVYTVVEQESGSKIAEPVVSIRGATGAPGRDGQDGSKCYVVSVHSDYDDALLNGKDGDLILIAEQISTLPERPVGSVCVIDHSAADGSNAVLKGNIQGPEGQAGRDGTTWYSVFNKEEFDSRIASGQDGDFIFIASSNVGPDYSVGSVYRITNSSDSSRTAELIANLQGSQGKPGADGKSAYQIAVDNGFSGTEQEWLESLKGADGATGEQFAQLEETVTEVQSSVDNLQTSVTTVESSVQSLEQSNTELSASVATNQSNISTIQGDVLKTQSDITQLETNVTNISTDLTDVKSVTEPLKDAITTEGLGESANYVVIDGGGANFN